MESVAAAERVKSEVCVIEIVAVGFSVGVPIVETVGRVEKVLERVWGVEGVPQKGVGVVEGEDVGDRGGERECVNEEIEVSVIPAEG